MPATTKTITMIPAVLPNMLVTAPVMLDNGLSLVSGYFLTYAFFPKKDIDFIERLALSFALSIAIVPLLVFYLNMLGMKINLISSFLTVLAIIIITIIFIIIRRKL